MSMFETYPKLLDSEWVDQYNLTGCFSAVEGNPYHDLDVAVALLRFRGNLSLSALALNRSRRSLANYIARNSELAELLEDLEAEILDVVEENLRSAARAGDLVICRFLATTKGRDRGYSVRNELTGKNGSAIESTLSFDMSSLSDEQLELCRVMREQGAME